MNAKSFLFSAAALTLAAGLAACEPGEREAEAETPVSAVEVETDLPPSAVSDQQLQEAADQAAGIAASPTPGAAVSPTPGAVVTGESATATTVTPQ